LLFMFCPEYNAYTDGKGTYWRENPAKMQLIKKIEDWYYVEMFERVSKELILKNFKKIFL
jgi:hypothetical protein